MEIFFIDDSNISINKKLEFFLYGGIIVDEEDILKLVKFLYNLKKNQGIKQERPIKWENINWHKEGILDPEKYKDIKKEVLGFIGQSSCRIIIYLAPQCFYHKVDTKKLQQETKFTIDSEKQIEALEFALNVCLQKFNSYLSENNSLGLVFADEFGGKKIKKYLKNYCFSLCPKGTRMSNLERIVYPVINIDSEYSAIHQINDIILGAVQYSLKEITYNFIPMIKKNFWGGEKRIIGKGISVYPKKARAQDMGKKLETIQNKIKRLIKNDSK